jgi:hypothetical protein
MRFILAPLLLAALIYGGWPYYEYYRLDQAVAASNLGPLEALVDLEAVRAAREASVQRRLQQQLPGQGPVAGMVREGARWLSGEAVSLEWVKGHLRGEPPAPGAQPQSLVERTDFAFFESPTRFIARLGEIDGYPLFVRMTFRDWQWRVTGLFGCTI